MIMFKSCYPASNVVGNGTEPGNPFSSTKTITNYKAVYRYHNSTTFTYSSNSYTYKPLERIFKENPDFLFIPVTAPPRHYGPGDATNDEEAHNARVFNNWLKNDWLESYNEMNPGLNNVAVYDWFDFLTYPDNHTSHPNRLKQSYGGDSGDSHPNTVANQESTVDFATGSDNFLDAAWNKFNITPKENKPPIADAGVDFSGNNNTLVVLNGSGSTDIDGSIEHWNWTCLTHTVALDFADTPYPSFVADATGLYTFTLKVQDNNLSWSRNESMVNVTIVESGNNLPPSADAGKDIWAEPGDNVTLNGSASHDIDGKIAFWEWNCTSHPGIYLNNTNSSHPYFVPLLEGVYRFTLRVMDDNMSWSVNDSVLVHVELPIVNLPPVSDAGDDIIENRGNEVSLNGSGSFDPDGSVIAYHWTCIEGGIALGSNDSAFPYFIADETGNFSFTLTVVDDLGAMSLSDQVNVTIHEKKIPPTLPDNVTPVIGPFLYENGTPLFEAKLTLHPINFSKWNEDLIINTTSRGYADFLQGIGPGNYSCIAEVNGTVVIGPFFLEVLRDGSVIIENGSIPRAPDPPQVNDDEDDVITPNDDDDDTIIPDDDTVDDDEKLPEVDESKFDAVRLILIAIVVIGIIAFVAFMVLLVIGKKPSNEDNDNIPIEAMKEIEE